jgi:hypothetical protein
LVHVILADACLGEQLVLHGDELLDAGVRDRERLEHVGFGDLERAALDHHDRVLGAGDDEVHVGELELLERGVEHPLALHASDAHAGDRALNGICDAFSAYEVARARARRRRSPGRRR